MLDYLRQSFKSLLHSFCCLGQHCLEVERRLGLEVQARLSFLSRWSSGMGCCVQRNRAPAFTHLRFICLFPSFSDSPLLLIRSLLQYLFTLYRWDN